MYSIMSLTSRRFTILTALIDFFLLQNCCFTKEWIYLFWIISLLWFVVTGNTKEVPIHAIEIMSFTEYDSRLLMILILKSDIGVERCIVSHIYLYG